MSDGGKGSNRRPSQVDDKVVKDNWDKIFKKKSRIDIIGQNGNEGIHYDSDDNVDRWSAVLRDEYDSKYWKDQ